MPRTAPESAAASGRRLPAPTAGHLTFYVAVPDVEETLAAAEGMSATRLMGPEEIYEGLTLGMFRIKKVTRSACSTARCELMRKLISYMFTSLDGFIADRSGGLDWTPIDDELMRFANEYFATMDGIVFGRNVYQGFVEYWTPRPQRRVGARGRLRRDLPRHDPDRRVDVAP